MSFIDKIIKDQRAKGGVVGFYMMVLIVIIVVLAVSIPVVVDQIDGVDGEYATATLTITGNVSCGQYVNITFLDGTYVKYQANFTAGAAGCYLLPGAIAWPLNAAPYGNNSINATYALAVAMNDDDSGNISDRLTFTNPSNGVMVATYYQQNDEANSLVTSESLSAGSWSGFAGGVDGVSTIAETVLNLLTLMLALGVLMLIMKPLM